MGAPPEVLAQARANASRFQEQLILPCNLEAVRVFWALSTQWRTVSGFRGVARLALDYTAIQPVLRFMAIPRQRWAEIFDALRIMESAALSVGR
jgi:hypothetical protein